VKTVHVGRLALDPGARQATVDGVEIVLTGYEFSLLYALASRAGRVLSREQLIELAGGSAEDAFDRSVDVHVSRLRQKLGDDPKNPRMLKTVRGSGYMLASEAG
jgi:DNA-binding response OmpR family regulator